MKRHSGEHGGYGFKVALLKEKKIKYVQRTSNHCVSQKKSDEWVNSYLPQKQIEKAQQYK